MLRVLPVIYPESWVWARCDGPVASDGQCFRRPHRFIARRSCCDRSVPPAQPERNRARAAVGILVAARRHSPAPDRLRSGVDTSQRRRRSRGGGRRRDVDLGPGGGTIIMRADRNASCTTGAAPRHRSGSASLPHRPGRGRRTSCLCPTSPHGPHSPSRVAGTRRDRATAMRFTSAPRRSEAC